MAPHRSVIALVLLAAMAAAPAARANDTSAELTTGGLVLTRHPDIEMRSEDLYISAKQVRVHYRFANTSNRDLTILVAFPMPDVTITGEDDMLSIPRYSRFTPTREVSILILNPYRPQ